MTQGQLTDRGDPLETEIAKQQQQLVVQIMIQLSKQLHAKCIHYLSLHLPTNMNLTC